MKKTLISLTDQQMEDLTKEAKELGISKSELLRRIMFMYLNTENRLANVSLVNGKPKKSEEIKSENKNEDKKVED